jgi:hypothetical protein
MIRSHRHQQTSDTLTGTTGNSAVMRTAVRNLPSSNYTVYFTAVKPRRCIPTLPHAFIYLTMTPTICYQTMITAFLSTR